MATVRTDGANAPVDQSGGWEAAYAVGQEFAASIESDADLGSGSSQGAGSGSSDGASETGSPSAPQADTTGDVGRSTPQGTPASPVADPGAPATPPDADPLAGAEPFTFSVDGESRTIEGAYRIPGDGLYVPEDKVPQFQLIASRAESLERQNRELYEKDQSWNRLTAWDAKDAQGNTVTLTGPEGLTAQRVALAEFASNFLTLDALIKDPQRLAELLMVQRDDQGNVVGFSTDEKAVANLQRDMAYARRDAADRARGYMSKVGTPPPPTEPSVAEIALPTVDATIKALNITGLTDKNRQFLATQLERYVRPATPQERITHKTNRIVDNSFGALAQELAAANAEKLAAANAGKKADAFNGGMLTGRQSNPAPQRNAAPAPQPQFTGRNAPKQRSGPSANDMWSSLIEDAKAAS